jgi:hypothetical protein
MSEPAGAASFIPQWFYQLTADHNARKESFYLAGNKAAGDAFEKHWPCLAEGVICIDTAYTQYPCSELRKHYDGAGLWEDLVRECDEKDPGWRDRACGDPL